VGPWGRTLSGQIENAHKYNTAFDENGYNEALENGCLPPPCKPYPEWPPKPGVGFIYPSLQKEEQRNLMGEEKGCFPLASPFVDETPVLPSVERMENVQDKDYTPKEILDMFDCAVGTPQPLENKCFGYMPYDATYMSSSRLGGWLSPVPITSPVQPVATGVNVPSEVISNRNPHLKKKEEEEKKKSKSLSSLSTTTNTSNTLSTSNTTTTDINNTHPLLLKIYAKTKRPCNLLIFLLSSILVYCVIRALLQVMQVPHPIIRNISSIYWIGMILSLLYLCAPTYLGTPQSILLLLLIGFILFGMFCS
jgi:hypothetical protein